MWSSAAATPGPVQEEYPVTVQSGTSEVHGCHLKTLIKRRENSVLERKFKSKERGK